MVFYNLHDAETMLDSTHDPIGDLVNATSSDVIDRIGSLTFQEFKVELRRREAGEGDGGRREKEKQGGERR
jgi:hypothetical protein